MEEFAFCLSPSSKSVSPRSNACFKPLIPEFLIMLQTTRVSQEIKGLISNTFLSAGCTGIKWAHFFFMLLQYPVFPTPKIVSLVSRLSVLRSC